MDVKRVKEEERLQVILSFIQMDYAGQKLAENIYYFLTIFFGAIAWIVGYIKEDFYVTVLGWSVGLGLALIVSVIGTYCLLFDF